jgi:hypothetical protein
MNKENETYRENLRRKLVRIFAEEYSTRKERGELFFEGRWIRPEEKMDFFDDMKEEHRKLLVDSMLLILAGIAVAPVLVLIIKAFLFPR